MTYYSANADGVNWETVCQFIFVRMISTQHAHTLKMLGHDGAVRLRRPRHRRGNARAFGPAWMVVPPARGLYRLADASVDTRRALVEAAALVAKGGICLVSALQLQGLTLQMPLNFWIGRTAWRREINYPPVRFVRFTGLALTEGVERHHIEGAEVATPSRHGPPSIAFRYRVKVGVDAAM